MYLNETLIIGLDENNVPVTIEIRIRDNQLSIVGNAEGQGGQIISYIEEFINDETNTLLLNKKLCEDIIKIWKEKHLSHLSDNSAENIELIVESIEKNNELYDNIELVNQNVDSEDVVSFSINDKKVSLYINEMGTKRTNSLDKKVFNVFNYNISYQIEDNITKKVLLNDEYEFQTSINDYMNGKNYMDVKELIFSFKCILENAQMVMERNLDEFIREYYSEIITDEDYMKVEDDYLELDRLASKLGYLIEGGMLNNLTLHEMTDYIGLQDLNIENIEHNNIMRF